MGTTLRWTSADLDVLPDDGKRYEIIDGELYVSRQPGYHHQYACSQLNIALGVWGAASGSGGAAGVLLGGALTSTLNWTWKNVAPSDSARPGSG